MPILTGNWKERKSARFKMRLVLLFLYITEELQHFYLKMVEREFFSCWIAVFSKLIFSNPLNTLALLSWSWTASRYFSLQVIWKKGVLFGIAFHYLIFWADYPYIKLISNGNIEVSNNLCCCWVDTKWDWYPYSVICDY